MKKISRLIQLLPYSRLDDFPTHLQGELADGVLAHWTAAWHPLLISAAGSAPVIYGADQTSFDNPSAAAFSNFETDSTQPPESTEDFDAEFWRDSLVFVPEISLESIAEGFAARVVAGNASLITGMTDRNQIIQRAGQLLNTDCATKPKSQSASNRVKDFFALAYAYLQIQLLTRKIRYSSNLDQAAFDSTLVEAAHAFADDNDAKCDAAIGVCYDFLLEEKNNYYPVKPTLIDLVLTTPKLAGAKLQSQFQRELDSKHVTNFLMTGATLASLKSDALEKLKSKVAEHNASVVGGNETELPDTLLSPETTLGQLKQGLSSFKTRLDYDVSIFMRRRFGLMSSLPNILDQLNFNGAMHTSLDGGKFPTGSFGTIRWAGDAAASILSKAETLLDASDPATLLDLGVTIGRQIDSAHEATCTFAHWPGHSHDAFDDLMRVAARSPVLGEFMTLDDHFETLYDPGYADNFSSAEYAAPFLDEALRASSVAPLSTTMAYWRQYFYLHLVECLIVQWTTALMMSKKFAGDDSLRETIEPWFDKCDDLKRRIESQAANWKYNRDEVQRIDVELETIAEQLLAQQSEPGGELAIVNPLFFSRIEAVSKSATSLPNSFRKSRQPYSIQQITDEKRHAVVEVKGSSVTPIESASAGIASTLLKKEPSVLDGEKLQNEFFVATIDPTTGALKSILFHGQRGNRASQRLVFQDKRSGQRSTMVCDAYEAVASSHLCGEIKTSGRILFGQKTVATFVQTFRLRRGQRVLALEIDIQPAIKLGGSQNQYFGHRLAWRDEACKIFGSDQFVRSEIYSPKIQSPNFVEIENLDYSLTVLPNGLAYHNRIDRRQLDTLLIVGNEQQQTFRLGIGVGLKYPLKSAIDFSCPTLTAEINRSLARQFFHLDSKNVLVTYVRPLFDDREDTLAFEMRLQETQRRGGTVTLHTPFKMAEVHRVNFHGDVVETLQDQEGASIDKIKLKFTASDYFQIRIVVDKTDAMTSSSVH